MQDKRLYHAIAHEIMKLINSGEFPAGGRLPGERELAERFGVSRVTIREAEIALQALGHVRIKTGSGVYVLESADGKNQGLPNVSAFELTEARAMFESEAAALTARHVSDETLERLGELVEVMSSDDPDNKEAAQNADREFHLTIAEASCNGAVKHIVETLWRMRNELPAVKEVHAAICAREDSAERTAEHAEVLEALRERDPSRARLAMQQHFRSLLEFMIDMTEEQALEDLRKKSTESRERFLNSVLHSRTA
jgi:DNA-binding FadR family transcriptional regulator